MTVARLRPSAPVGVALAGLLVTAMWTVVPSLRFAYRNPELHLALVTSEALIAMLAALLAGARFRRTRRLDALLLAVALGVLSTTNFVFAALPAIFASDTSGFSSWSTLVGRMLGALLLAAAALAPPRSLREQSRLAPAVAAACGAALLLPAALFAVLGEALPTFVDPAATPENSGGLRLEAHPAVLAAHALGLAAFAAAAAGFARRARPARDRLFRALAVGCALGAVGRLNYVLFASTATPYVYLGDGFRLLFYLFVLAGTIAEMGSYWRSVAHVAALEERRAIARDLHDGIAQELATIQRQLYYLDPHDRSAIRAREAADRGAAAARRALQALASPGEEEHSAALSDVARAVAEREGTQLRLDVSERVRLGRSEREALSGIVSEAITNAARHGSARRVTVELSGGREVVLRVRDDGSGFDPQAVDGPTPDGGGHGIPGMHARAQAIGARLTIASSSGTGTTVEVRL